MPSSSQRPATADERLTATLNEAPQRSAVESTEEPYNNTSSVDWDVIDGERQRQMEFWSRLRTE
jgi:hypothetical protein